MDYLALSILFSATAWSLGLLISTFARASSGVGPILSLVYFHPSRLLLISLIAAFVVAVIVLIYTERIVLTLCSIPPVIIGFLLMLYQCLDMNAWYLAHYPYSSFQSAEPFNLVFLAILFILKAAVLSGISLVPALYSLDSGVRGRKRGGSRSTVPFDVILISLGATVLLALLSLLSSKTGFGMHYLARGYLRYLF